MSETPVHANKLRCFYLGELARLGQRRQHLPGDAVDRAGVGDHAGPSGRRVRDLAVIEAWNERVPGSRKSQGSRHDWSRQRVSSSRSYQRASASSTGLPGCFSQ